MPLYPRAEPVAETAPEPPALPLIALGRGKRQEPATLGAALERMHDAEDALRAIGAGEVDAFVVSEAESGQRVFTLSTADRPYRIFVENMRDGAATLSASGIILYANQRLAGLLSLPRETIVGMPLAALIPGKRALGRDQLRGEDGVGATFELDLLDAAGMPVPVLVGSSPLDVSGEPVTCLTFTDLAALREKDREIARLSHEQAERMTDLQKAQAALVEQATHDGLTHLPNRALLVDRIDQALFTARRTGSCVAVLFIDIDRFKQINDTNGHAAGDAVLRKVARNLVAALRPMDTVARIGGDEFIVLAPSVDSRRHAAEMSARLLAELSRAPAEGDHVTASVGITVSVAGHGTAETLLSEADAAMYKAKSLGGGRAEVFDEALGRQAQERLGAEQMLHAALSEDRVVAHYQPIVDLGNGRVAGVEALARIDQQDGSFLSPERFIPVAEDTGLVIPLGERVLTTACTAARRWPPRRPDGRDLTIAVNLSPRQLAPGDLTSVVRQTLEQTGLDATRLHLELTETALMDLRPEFLDQLAGLRDLGVQIGLDDFGTGYASLTHLRQLPLNFVKIDRSFVQGLATDQGDDRIIAAVVDLAAHLGLRSIAEGIETRGQLDRLRELGCDQAQGYLCARPMPACDVPAAIRSAAW
jgi:diguanylate cyclase (GGDEF)-like protein